MKSSLPSIALKVQRRKNAGSALREIAVHHSLAEWGLDRHPVSTLRESFPYDGHVCMAFEFCGVDMYRRVKEKVFSIDETRHHMRTLLRFLNDLHQQGAAHADLKPENLVYAAETGDARVIDFGNADRKFRQGSSSGTREYIPPEVMLGCEQDASIDIWAAACVTFELLTGNLLFHPHRVAEEKYQEFSDDDDDEEVIEEEDEEQEEDEELLDEQEEEAEQLEAGTVLHGKYRLIEELGRGKYATAWKCELLHDNPLPKGILEAFIKQNEAIQAEEAEMDENEEDDDEGPPAAAPPSIKDNRRVNRKQFGCKDVFDLALNYEHLLLIQQHVGNCPPKLSRKGLFHRVYCTENGRLKFDPNGGGSASIAARLVDEFSFNRRDAEAVEAFLMPMLTWDPKDRVSAAECLEHSWLRSPKPATRKRTRRLAGASV